MARREKSNLDYEDQKRRIKTLKLQLNARDNQVNKERIRERERTTNKVSEAVGRYVRKINEYNGLSPYNGYEHGGIRAYAPENVVKGTATVAKAAGGAG